MKKPPGRFLYDTFFKVKRQETAVVHPCVESIPELRSLSGTVPGESVMAERTQETVFDSLFIDHHFMRIPRSLPCSSSKEPGIGLTVDGNQLIYNDGESNYYWQKRPVERDHCDRIVVAFQKKGAVIHRH
ncbi:MAG TPA: hypothetical protein VGN56_01595 [Candidatus Paceibacterota bacterium]|jgi:hypothetical protein|nr:hypothetical protein [Candidatus Paceibacterota bacterium]